MYQALLPTTPAPKSTDAHTDTRSVHFLPFPTMRKEYFDPVIERQVRRMRAVVDLGRSIRDKKNLKVKVCEIPSILASADTDKMKNGQLSQS